MNEKTLYRLIEQGEGFNLEWSKRWSERWSEIGARINPSAVQKHIENLKKKGVLRRIGPARGGHWEVVVDE